MTQIERIDAESFLVLSAPVRVIRVLMMCSLPRTPIDDLVYTIENRSTRLYRNPSPSPADAPETQTNTISSRNLLAPGFVELSSTRLWSTAGGAGSRRALQRRSLHARPDSSRGPFPCDRGLPNSGHKPSARHRAPLRWSSESRASYQSWAHPYQVWADAGKRLPDPGTSPLPRGAARTAQALRLHPSDRERSSLLRPEMTAAFGGLRLLFSPPDTRPPAIFRELTNMNR